MHVYTFNTRHLADQTNPTVSPTPPPLLLLYSLKALHCLCLDPSLSTPNYTDTCTHLHLPHQCLYHSVRGLPLGSELELGCRHIRER